MSDHAKGTFEVKMLPEEAPGGESVVGRMKIDKVFKGDIEGTSEGLMVMTMTQVEGSAGYVALEKVTGTVNGKRGSFYLQHSGVMRRGHGQVTIVVVPDSGTDELTGIDGSFGLTITEGEHFYDFEYTLD